MAAVLSDLGTAARGVLRRPWTSGGVIVTLGLGLAAAAVAGSIAHRALVEALPFPDADRIVRIDRIYTPNALVSGLRLEDFDAWQPRLDTMATLAGVSTERVVARQPAGPIEVSAAFVVGDFFRVFGVPAAAGRTFDDREADSVAVASWDFARRLESSPDALVGTLVNVDGRTLTIVGVMPASFAAASETTALWINGRYSPPRPSLGAGDARSYVLSARLADAMAILPFTARATDVMDALTPGAQRGNWQLLVTPLRDSLVGDASTTLGLVLAAAMLFLTVACANAAVLMINGIVARAPEAVVRLSLGAGPWRLLRLHWFEMAWLVLAAGAAGWSLAAGSMRLLRSLTGTGIPAMATLDPDIGRAAGLGMLVVAGLCGTAQWLALAQTRRTAFLRSPSTTPARGGRRLRAGLVLAQVSTAVVLLASAGLLGRAFLDLSRTDIGLDGRDRAFVVTIPVGDSLAARDEATRAIWLGNLLGRIRTLPNVVAAGAGGALPPGLGQLAFTVRRVTDAEDTTVRVDVVSGTSGYLEALGARLVSGRTFSAAEGAGNDAVVVASESSLRHLGMSADDVGSPLRMSLPTRSGPRVQPTLIGVVEDIRFTGLAAEDTGNLFVPWRRLPNSPAFLFVRTSGAPGATMAAVAELVRAADPSLPVRPPEAFRTAIEHSVAAESSRFTLVLLCAMATALLAMVGLGGTLARWVVERRRELAIRAAIGASPQRLLWSTLVRGLALAAAGAAAGACLALAAGRVLAASVQGVAPVDYGVLAAVVAGVLVLAIAAAATPARRASQADPLSLLRTE